MIYAEQGKESSGLPPGELLPAEHCGADRLGMATLLWNNEGPAPLPCQHRCALSPLQM